MPDPAARKGPAKINRAYSVLEIRSLDADERIIEGMASTPTPDRLGDVVESLGAKFTLPMPLLLHHRHDQPVGHVEFAEPTADGIPFRARIERVDEPGRLKDRVDEAWQSLKAKLIRGVSIGFSPLEWAFMKDGGIHFKEWEWLELSLVTIPANTEATIQAIKSIDQGLQAASGPMEPRPTRPGASGKDSINLKPRATGMSKTIAEQIAALEARRSANMGRMEEIMKAAADEGRSTDDAEREEFDGLETEVGTLDGDLKRFRALEKANVAKATPVTNVKTVDDGAAARGGAVRITSPKPEPGVRFAQVVKCLGAARGSLGDALAIAESQYGDDQGVVNVLRVAKATGKLSLDVTKAAVGAGTTSNPSWAGALVGDETSVFADFVEFLRPQTIVGRFGAGGIPSLRRVPFRVPLIGQTSGGQGYWVGEGRAKPLTKFDFERKTLEPLKVANIAVITEELLRDSSPSADILVRDGLAAALRERMDEDFIDPTNSASAGVRPASITNGIAAIPSAGGDAAGVREDIRRVMSAFIAANNPPTSGVWIIPATTALSLSLMMNPLGQPEFPTVTMTGGTLFGLPVITSEYVPVTVTSPPDPDDGALVILLNASDIYLGDEGGISVDMSREASLQMDDNPNMTVGSGSPGNPTAASLVSLWQTNSVGFRAERTINWMRRREGGVQVLSVVNWGVADEGE